jgi:hypothetical protein
MLVFTSPSFRISSWMYTTHTWRLASLTVCEPVLPYTISEYQRPWPTKP